MKRLIRTLLTALVASSLLADPALADRKDRGGRGGHEHRSERQHRGYEHRGDGGRRDRHEHRGPRGGRWGDDGPHPSYGYGPPAYSRRQAPPDYGLRRGGTAPPRYRGAIVPDYSRHRLRPPPPGFAWIRAGDRYLLVSRATGQIFDIIGD